jgi:hypothetical protein
LLAAPLVVALANPRAATRLMAPKKDWFSANPWDRLVGLVDWARLDSTPAESWKMQPKLTNCEVTS